MRSILLCVDTSDYAVSAAEHAIALSKVMDSHVDILYVSDIKGLEMSTIADFGGSIGAQPFQEMLTSVTIFEKNKAETLQKKFTQMFSDAGLDGKFKFHHHTGSIADSLENFKTDLTGLDLVILGKRGESSDKEGDNVGKLLESVLRSSTVPCFVASGKPHAIKKVLLAYDGSETSTKAVHFIERNSMFNKCNVHILSVEPDKELRENMKEAEALLSQAAGMKVTIAQKRKICRRK